ncbi:MAG: MBL fold metallo-hydrolase [Myxococcales bacterium]
MAEMTIEFHGVRGSLASPGPGTAQVGGNTSCVEVRTKETSIFLDAGTGLRSAGERLLGRMPLETTILLSHLHWDHIQGLPFFTPLYVPGNRLNIVSGPNGVMPLEQALSRQMCAPFFPVEFQEVLPQVKVGEHRPGASFQVGECTVKLARLNHPDPVYGYRIELGGRSVVYATDTEHFACVDPMLRRLAEGADVLIYDAQYTPEEYRGDNGRPRVGWGHSTYEAAAELAKAAGVKQLVLFHHDPTRHDAAVAELEEKARGLFADTIAAREGAQLVLETGRASSVAEAVL